MTPADVIAEVRNLVQDTRAPFRNSDTLLLGFVNQTVKMMLSFRPDLFATFADISTVAGNPLQSLPVGAVRLVEVFRVVGGRAVTEVVRETLDQMAPNWVSAAPGQPVNFMRHPRNPTRFFVYPPPAAGVQLHVEYVLSPTEYQLNSLIVLPDAYLPHVVAGTVYLTESQDNEHINTGRAKLFYDNFVQMLGVSAQTRIVTDAEGAAVASQRG